MKRIIANAKEEYIKGQLEENENNPRKFWRNISEISGLGQSKRKRDMGKIVYKNGTEYENHQAANYLNTFYTDAGPKQVLIFTRSLRREFID